MRIEVSVPSNFGRNNVEMKRITKYQNLKNGVKRSWKLKSDQIVPFVIGATGMIKKELHKGPTNYPWEYYHKQTTVGGCPRLSDGPEIKVE